MLTRVKRRVKPYVDKLDAVRTQLGQDRPAHPTEFRRRAASTTKASRDLAYEIRSLAIDCSQA